MHVKISLPDVLYLYSLHNNILKPVNKLLNKEELYEILENYKFKNEVYSLPYMVFVNDLDINKSDMVSMYYDNIHICDINVEDIYKIDMNYYIKNVFNTDDIAHPGVKYFKENYKEKCYTISGYINYVNNKIIDILNIPFVHTDVTGISYVFQSRNPPHIIHQKIIEKYAPNIVYSFPYLSIKEDDYSFNKRLKCYNYIKNKYNIKLLTTLLMRYLAGPREALQNLLLFKNYGFKYFVMGRGKNTVGDFYGETESYEFCKQYEDILDIKIQYEGDINLPNYKIKASEIKKDFIDKGIIPPDYLMDPAIAKILLEKEE